MSNRTLRHHLRTLHPILLPGFILFGAFMWLLATTREGETRIMLVQMATAYAVLISVWLLLRQYIGTLIIGAQGFDDLRRDISEIRRLPVIDRLLNEQRRRESGSDPETPPPVVPPTFNP